MAAKDTEWTTAESDNYEQCDGCGRKTTVVHQLVNFESYLCKECYLNGRAND
jgi:ribosomal protein S14